MIITKGLNEAEREALNGRTGRPMRGSRKIEGIVKRGELRIASAHMDFIAAVLQAIPGPSIETVRRSASKAVHLHTHDECCAPITKAAFTPQQSAQISAQLETLAGKDIVIEVDRAAQQLFDEVFGGSVDIFAATLYKEMLREVVLDALQDGFDRAVIAWEREAARSRAWALANPLKRVLLEVTPQHAWLQGLYDQGFALVKDKIFRDIVPSLKDGIVKGIGANKTWTQIASDIYIDRGKDDLWKWQRLVRTEMSGAIQKSNIEQYRAMGVGYIKWSAAPGRCAICDAIARENDGYYSLDAAPVIPWQTHPNCRCTALPVSRLPSGVTVE
jgi:hypothetical protein